MYRIMFFSFWRTKINPATICSPTILDIVDGRPARESKAMYT